MFERLFGSRQKNANPPLATFKGIDLAKKDNQSLFEDIEVVIYQIENCLTNEEECPYKNFNIRINSLLNKLNLLKTLNFDDVTSKKNLIVAIKNYLNFAIFLGQIKYENQQLLNDKQILDLKRLNSILHQKLDKFNSKEKIVA